MEAILKPHTGYQQGDNGETVEYTHPDQYMVYVMMDGETRERFMGYIAKKSGAPFCGFTTFAEQPQAIQDLIMGAISRAIGESRACGTLPLSAKVSEEFDG